MRKPVIIICALAFLTVVFFACKHAVETPATPAPGTGSDSSTSSPTGICFESDILPIFKSSCAKSGCHDASSHQDGYVFDTYANIVKKDVRPGNASNSKVYKVLIERDLDDRMPRRPNPPLTAAQITLIRNWINEGAKNTVNCSGGCDATVFTYSQAIRPLLDANCVGCHNSATAGGGLNYTTYAGVRTVALNGRLLGAITHSAGYKPMPQGSVKLSDCKIEQVRKWIQAGAPEN